MSEAHDVTIPYFILTAFNVYIIAPVGLYLTVPYYNKRNEHQYNARRPTLVVVHNLFSIFVVAIYIPLHIIFFEIMWDNNGTDSEWWEVISWDSIQIAVNLSLSLRVWHSFYDFQLAHYSSRQWKSILDEDRRQEEQPLFVRCKHFFGMCYCG